MLKLFDRRAAKSSASEVAVIDVGSNSIRLVVYRVAGLAMTPILNEKAMAALGRGVSSNAAPLPEKGVRIAFEALKRFSTIIQGHGIRHIEAVATSAVREAKDGEAFAARVRKELNIPLRVIDGTEEARLSALGVIAGAPEADGVVADQGAVFPGSCRLLVAFRTACRTRRSTTAMSSSASRCCRRAVV